MGRPEVVRSRHLVWLLACALLAAGVGLALGRADSDSGTAAVAAPGTKILPAGGPEDGDHAGEPEEDPKIERVPLDEPLHTLADGRGNELVLHRHGHGGQFFCEKDGLHESMVNDLIREPEQPETRTPRELIAWQLEGTAVATRVDAVVGEVSLSETRVSEEEVREVDVLPDGLAVDGLVDRSGADALQALPGARESRTRLGVALVDPNRPENQQAGYVYFELLPEGGWAITTMGICYSMVLGEYVPAPDVPTIEPGPDTTFVDVGDPGNEVPENE